MTFTNKRLIFYTSDGNADTLIVVVSVNSAEIVTDGPEPGVIGLIFISTPPATVASHHFEHPTIVAIATRRAVNSVSLLAPMLGVFQ